MGLNFLVGVPPNLERSQRTLSSSCPAQPDLEIHLYSLFHGGQPFVEWWLGDTTDFRVEIRVVVYSYSGPPEVSGQTVDSHL